MISQHRFWTRLFSSPGASVTLGLSNCRLGSATSCPVRPSYQRLAKCADEDIPAPREWIEQFETFPVDVVAPEVFSLIFKGVVSSKNLKRLEDLKKRIQPTSISTQSSSPDSKED